MYQVDDKGFFGKFGGAYVPEILYKCVTELQQAYKPIIESEEFKKEYHQLLRDYVGRPSPLYYAKRMSEKYGCQLYLKREDLNHTGAHKINNTIGQILMAKKMGKTRIIAETGAGQHGVATATVCALMDMKCEIFMGATDVERQHTNVERMKMLGAKVNPVRTGNMTLSDACSEAIRDWCCHPQDTFYIVGSTMGPHPYPDIVAKMQSVISEELKWQLQERWVAIIPITSSPVWAEAAMRQVPFIIILMMSAYRFILPRQQDMESTPTIQQPPCIAEQKVLSMGREHS